MTGDLLQFADWIVANGVTHVAGGHGGLTTPRLEYSGDIYTHTACYERSAHQIYAKPQDGCERTLSGSLVYYVTGLWS